MGRDRHGAGAAVLRDPRKNLPDSGPPAVDVEAPFLNARGTGQGTYILSENLRSGAVVDVVSCITPGRFTVASNGQMMLDSACTGRAEASTCSAPGSLQALLSVTAPGAY